MTKSFKKTSSSSLYAERSRARLRSRRRAIPVLTIRLSPGDHSELIKAVIEEFAPRFAPGGVLVYAGDTGEKWGYFDKALLAKLGMVVDGHGKMPDVVLYYRKREW